MSSRIGPSPNSSRSSSRCVTPTGARLGRGPHLSGIEPRDARGRLGVFAASTPKRDRQGHARRQGIISAHAGASKVAATALLTAIEMLEGHPLLAVDREVRLPLLTPFNSSAPQGDRAGGGAASRGRLSHLQDQGRQGPGRRPCARARDQRAIDGRGTMGSTPTAPFPKPMLAALPLRSIRRASSCSSSRAGEDWDANANVAKVSTVPIMLDEPICELADVRAGIGYSQCRLLQAQAETVRRPRSASRGARCGKRGPAWSPC